MSKRVAQSRDSGKAAEADAQQSASQNVARVVFVQVDEGQTDNEESMTHRQNSNLPRNEKDACRERKVQDSVIARKRAPMYKIVIILCGAEGRHEAQFRI
jgi:hypothetical protein